MAYSDKVLEHYYENPRNVGSFARTIPPWVRAWLARPRWRRDEAAAQINDAGVIEDAKFKTFGCGSAIASSSLATEWVKGMTIRSGDGDQEHPDSRGAESAAGERSTARCWPRTRSRARIADYKAKRASRAAGNA